MKAVLLCAGFATRLYPLTRDRAKPLLPLGKSVVLSDLVEQIDATGAFDQLVVVSNARFHRDFEAWAAEIAPALGALRLEVLDDGAQSNRTRLGAVRDLAFAVDRLKVEEAVLVAAGDNLFCFPLGELLDDYRRRPRNLVVVEEQQDLQRLRRTGVVEVDGAGRIRRLWEKPSAPATTTCSAPLYLLRPEAMALLPEFLRESPRADAPGHFISFLVARLPVFAHYMRGERLDLGDLETYRRGAAWLAERRRGRP